MPSSVVILAIIILAIWEALQPPPESEISKWIGNVGKRIDIWAPSMKAPPVPLVVSSTPSDGKLNNSTDPQKVQVTFRNVSPLEVKIDALELEFEVAKEKSALFTEAHKFEKIGDDNVLKKNQFEVSVDHLTSPLEIRAPINIPKTWAVAAKSDPDAYTVTITLTGQAPAVTADKPDQHDTLDHFPFSLGPLGSLTVTLFGVSNINVDKKEDLGITWRQFWNQGQFDQDENRCWLYRDK